MADAAPDSRGVSVGLGVPKSSKAWKSNPGKIRRALEDYEADAADMMGLKADILNVREIRLDWSLW